LNASSPGFAQTRQIPPLPAALGLWYANPMDEATARRLLLHGQRRVQQAHRDGDSDLYGELEQLLARFALAEAVGAQLDFLVQAAGDPGKRGLLLLLQGQLLISRRLDGAMDKLEQGFELARDVFLAGDFFVVMKRHELLAELPLLPQPRPQTDLSALLSEASAIRRLRGPRGARRWRHDGGDTLG